MDIKNGKIVDICNLFVCLIELGVPYKKTVLTTPCKYHTFWIYEIRFLDFRFFSKRQKDSTKETLNCLNIGGNTVFDGIPFKEISVEELAELAMGEGIDPLVAYTTCQKYAMMEVVK